MASLTDKRLLSALTLCLVSSTFVVASFLRQDAGISPTPLSSFAVNSPATQTPSAKPTPSPVPTAQNFHQWGSITLFNGLPSDSIRAIAQTADGVMWFGTDNGLARFDGRRIQNFSFGEPDANHVLVLRTDPLGQLWIGTQKGAFVYSENRFQPIGGTETIGITAILFGDENFLGTDGGLILRVTDDENGARTAATLLARPILGGDATPVRITSLTKYEGKLLVATAGRGLFTFENGSISGFVTLPHPTFVNSVSQDRAGTLWLGADAAKGISGIYALKGRAEASRLAANTGKVLAVDAKEDDLWAGTERNGLFHAIGSKVSKTYTFENTSGGLRSNTILALFTDRESVVWIGTNRGVSRFDPTGPIQENVSDSPNSNFIRMLWESGDGRALFAGSNRGLFSYDAEKWKRVDGPGDKPIYAVGTTMNGMTVGTATGTFDLNGKLITGGDTRSFEMFHGETYAAVVGRGVIDITSGKQEVVFPDETTCSLLVGDDKLWIGTAGDGLFSFDGRRVQTEAAPDNLKSGTIWKIFDDADRNIWIAGQHGVFRVKNGTVEQVIEAEDVRDVFVHGADIWAATTTRGLLHSRHDELFGWLVSAIGFEQGLPSEKAFSIVPRGDGLLIATNRGVVRYHPHNIPPKLIPVRVQSKTIHDLSELNSTIALDYPQNSLQIEVAGQSSRTFPEEFQYSFLLKNSQGEIVDSRFSKDAQYSPSGLRAGEYIIESIAYDRDLLASEPLQIGFSVAKEPFPWTATALGILLAIALIALIWAMIERRHIALRNAELAAARFDLANEAERERSRIARDLHDQTLADLRNLLMMSDRLSPRNPEFRSEIESVSTEIRRICEDLSPSVLENVGLVAALEFLLSRSDKEHKFSADENANERIKFSVIDQLHIYRIAQEILTNIDRHSDATTVEMSVEVSADNFGIAIRDNGATFEPQLAAKKGRGISNIRSRAGLINASIKWQHPVDGGNIFSLAMPGR
jgi:signal transduction histidine kinase/ligand-binding sensor domain-containing protein